ncbi:hypothetical protein CBL_08453 [Carabus blaptoides fortunei]
MKRSLKRHLQDTHQIKEITAINQCRACNQEIGPRPSNHRCEERLPQQNTPAPNRHWTCNSCDSAFPTTLGLRNHQREHRRRARLQIVNTPLTRPRTRRNTRVVRRQTDEDSSSEPDTIASRTRSRASSRESPDPTPSPPPPLRLSPIAASPNTDPHHPQPKPKPTPSPPHATTQQRKTEQLTQSPLIRTQRGELSRDPDTSRPRDSGTKTPGPQ